MGGSCLKIKNFNMKMLLTGFCGLCLLAKENMLKGEWTEELDGYIQVIEKMLGWKYQDWHLTVSRRHIDLLFGTQ